jgi:hypothetical protein
VSKKTTSHKIPADLQLWIDVRGRFRLSDAHIQMARELGLNPKKFGGLANHRQEPWKRALPELIELLYFKRFARTVPDRVLSIEKRFQEIQAQKAARRAARLARGNEEPKTG